AKDCGSYRATHSFGLYKNREQSYGRLCNTRRLRARTVRVWRRGVGEDKSFSKRGAPATAYGVAHLFCEGSLAGRGASEKVGVNLARTSDGFCVVWDDVRAYILRSAH